VAEPTRLFPTRTGKNQNTRCFHYN
jgi:hypothetical protein